MYTPFMPSNRRTIFSTGSSTRRKRSMSAFRASSCTIFLTFAQRSLIFVGWPSSHVLNSELARSCSMKRRFAL